MNFAVCSELSRTRTAMYCSLRGFLVYEASYHSDAQFVHQAKAQAYTGCGVSSASVQAPGNRPRRKYHQKAGIKEKCRRHVMGKAQKNVYG